MFHSLTLTKQTLAVCSYTLEKRSAKKAQLRRAQRQRRYGHHSRGNTLAEEQRSPSLGWRGRHRSRPQPPPGQARPIPALDAVLPSWHPICPIPVISTMALHMNFTANTRRARSGQMRVLCLQRWARGTGRVGCPRSEALLAPSLNGGHPGGGHLKARPTPGPARGTTRSEWHRLQTSFSSPRLLPSAGFYSSKSLRPGRGRLQREHRGDKGRKVQSCCLPSIAHIAASSV